MSFLAFIQSLQLPFSFSFLFFAMLAFLVGFGIYKFVKDWFPW